jgi:hypothetical protein
MQGMRDCGGAPFRPAPCDGLVRTMALPLACIGCIGAVTAAVNTALLARNARLYTRPDGATPAVALHLVRASALVVAFVTLALAGPRPLLAAVAGFSCAHLVSIPAMRRLA